MQLSTPYQLRGVHLHDLQTQTVAALRWDALYQLRQSEVSRRCTDEEGREGEGEHGSDLRVTISNTMQLVGKYASIMSPSILVGILGMAMQQNAYKKLASRARTVIADWKLHQQP